MPDLDVIFPEGTSSKWQWMISEEEDESEESEESE